MFNFKKGVLLAMMSIINANPGAKQVLYLASGSAGRRRILDLAQIPYVVHKHNSGEEKEIKYQGQNPAEFVTTIAKDKVTKVALPEEAKEYDKVFLLTSDTLVFTKDRELLSKPVDKADAANMIKTLAKGPIDVVTVSVLEERKWTGEEWQTVSSKVLHSPVEIWWVVPEDQIEFYLSNKDNYLKISSASDIEYIGGQYLKSINGCYWSAIGGFPLYKLRQELEQEGFLTRGVAVC